MTRVPWLVTMLCKPRCGIPAVAQLLGLLALFSGLGFAATNRPTDRKCLTQNVTQWQMLNVSPGHEQADCHLIVLPDGRNVLIDIGEAADAPGAALAALKAAKVTRLDLVIISHFHVDHYGRLLDLIDSGVQIKRVAVNVPDEATARAEQPWGCSYDDVLATLAGLRKRGVPYFTPAAGDCLIESTVDGRSLAKLEVVCLYQGLNAPMGPTDVNDTSIILRLTHGANRTLFTGDLNHGLGTWLATSKFDLAADVLKVPHHGTEACAPDEFFDRVHPTAALVPGPKSLWASGRSMRIRNYFASHAIPTYVSGMNGNVTVTFKGDTYSIESER
ncbi:MAG: MBL fold metallo-hydrolase [Opitutus sp.]